MGRTAHRCKSGTARLDTLAPMTEPPSGARVALAAEGAASVETGVPVLDHLVGELARVGRFRLSLEVAPESTDEAVVAAGRALGRAFGAMLDRRGETAHGWGIMPSDEALAAASLERVEEGRFATNVDFSAERVGGVSTDIASRFLAELAGAARLNLHVRLLEGTEPQHVLDAIFKAIGGALGQACRPVDYHEEEAT